MGLRRSFVERYLTQVIPEDGYISFGGGPISRETDGFHICTIGNRKRRHLDKLVLSCKQTGNDLQILGMGRPYPGNFIKLFWMADYLKGLEDDEIVMFVDGFDVLVLADRAIILEKFKKMHAPIVMSTERGCYPFLELKEKYPSSATSFRFINSGGYIGYVGALKEWIADMGIHKNSRSDQGQITVHFLKEPKKNFLTLDYNCEIFLTLYKVEKDEIEIDSKTKTLNCLTTHSTPCILHANAGPAGGAFAMWNEIYRKLIKKNLLHKFLK